MKELHPFLRHFTAIICCIVYNYCSEEEYKAYHPELLFNLICFGRFVEMYKENEEYNNIVKKIFKRLLSAKTRGFEAENFQEYFKYKYKAFAPVILESFNKGDQTDLEVLKKTKIIFDGNSEPYLKRILSNATFENFFGFLGYFKRYYFYEVVSNNVNNCVYDFSLPESFHLNYYLNRDKRGCVSQMKNSVEILIRNMNCMFNDQQYKVIIQFISEKIVAKVLNDQSRVDEIFNFNENHINFQNTQGDRNFPRAFLEILCEESDVTYIKNLYDFLKKITKEEYHKYISAVLCLKALCLRKETLDKNNIPRIIIEFLFLADVLKKEFETDENVKNIKMYRKNNIDNLKKAVNIQNIEYADNAEGEYLDCEKVPETSILLEIYGFIEFFSNDNFKTYLTNEMIKIMPEGKKRPINVEEIKNEYLKYVFLKETSGLRLEEIKLLFGKPLSKNLEKVLDPKNPQNGAQKILTTERSTQGPTGEPKKGPTLGLSQGLTAGVSRETTQGPPLTSQGPTQRQTIGVLRETSQGPTQGPTPTTPTTQGPTQRQTIGVSRGTTGGPTIGVSRGTTGGPTTPTPTTQGPTQRQTIGVSRGTTGGPTIGVSRGTTGGPTIGVSRGTTGGPTTPTTPTTQRQTIGVSRGTTGGPTIGVSRGTTQGPTTPPLTTPTTQGPTQRQTIGVSRETTPTPTPTTPPTPTPTTTPEQRPESKMSKRSDLKTYFLYIFSAFLFFTAGLVVIILYFYK
ncbi:hypothetical protein LUQ84_002050 [Hamiltosporidium tvaerminnensis]|nr:hypothetical protein LUQ84_002050 [Hamiltosporidium tvaerminnensis]